MDEAILAIFAILLCAGLVIGVPLLALIAYVRSRRVVELEQRIARLETALRQSASRPSIAPVLAATPPPAVVDPSELAAIGAGRPAQSSPTPTRSDPVIVATAIDDFSRNAEDLESFIGLKALGWAAVIVLIFATGFFLRYAFANGWIGPIGQIALAAAGGLVLVATGWRRQRQQQPVVAQMLAAAGIVLLYLAAYSSFGFYHLIDARTASLFLFIIVVESALLAVRFEAPSIALMAVIGGLLTPLLMHSDHDQYQSLFAYLLVLNVGVVGLLAIRTWVGIGSLALFGTQGLFWAWHAANYHPEKLAWALGFQVAMLAIYFFSVLRQGRTRAIAAHSLNESASHNLVVYESLVITLATAAFAAAAGYSLLRNDYRPWLATLALSMALVYAFGARLLLTLEADRRLVLAFLGVASGFVAAAIPLQANAQWVAVGWAAEAAVLWWFGLRAGATELRVASGMYALLAAWHVFAVAPWLGRATYVPIFNRFALPSLVAVSILIAAIALGRRLLARASEADRILAGMVLVGSVLLVWWIVGFDLHGYFTYQYRGSADPSRLAQMSLSAWSAIYATVVLAIGFAARVGVLRWTALGLYGLTLAKVFLYDMSDLDEIYRIVAFFVLAIVLGAAAWAYQRFGRARPQEKVA